MVTGYSSGFAFSDGQIEYVAPSGSGQGTWLAPEANTQIRARDSYTWANLAVRVITNTLTNACAIVSRVGGGDGNMSISVGAGLTGLFRDVVNSDALVSGNLFDIEIDPPAGGTSIIITAFATTLTTVANTTPIIIGSFPPANVMYAPGATTYFAIVGELRGDGTEAHTQYTCRVASTLSKLHTYVDTNTLNVIATIRPRIGGADVNSVCSIPVATSGLFEDGVNTDAIAIGNLICHELELPAGAGGIYVSFMSFQSDSTGEWIGEASGQEAILNDGDVRYWVIDGKISSFSAAEAATQMPVQANGTARNMLLRIPSNTLNDSSVWRHRVNGGDGNLVITVAGWATGTFEDLVNSDALITTDSWNWEVDATAPGSGSVKPQIIALQFDQAAAPTGIEDKSAAMGNKMVGIGLI